MRLPQNGVLLLLICLLLSLLLGLETTNVVSISPKLQQISKQKNNTNQPINIEILWNITSQIKKNNEIIPQSKQIILEIINDLPPEIQLGIITFGVTSTPNANQSANISTTNNNKQQLLNFINQARPTGNYSLSSALLQAKHKLKNKQGKKHIIIVAHGYDTKRISLTTAVNQLNKNGIKIHVIQAGNIKPRTKTKLKSLAQKGNGNYFSYFERKEIISSLNLY